VSPPDEVNNPIFIINKKLSWCWQTSSYCVFSFFKGGRPPSWIFIFPQFLRKIQICAYYYYYYY